MFNNYTTYGHLTFDELIDEIRHRLNKSNNDGPVRELLNEVQNFAQDFEVMQTEVETLRKRVESVCPVCDTVIRAPASDEYTEIANAFDSIFGREQ